MSVSGLRENRTSRSKGRGWTQDPPDHGRATLKTDRETIGPVRCPTYRRYTVRTDPVPYPTAVQSSKTAATPCALGT